MHTFIQKALLLSALLASLLANSALAAIILTPSGVQLEVLDNKLSAAYGIAVNNSTYNVEFTDGNVTDLFFNQSNTPIGLSEQFLFVQALSDLVFLDINFSDNNFDSRPALTKGCEDQSRCVVQSVTVTSLTAGIYSHTHLANHSNNLLDDFGTGTDTLYLSDTFNRNEVTYALWEKVSVVSEPPTLAILIVLLLPSLFRSKVPKTFRAPLVRTTRIEQGQTQKFMPSPQNRF